MTMQKLKNKIFVKSQNKEDQNKENKHGNREK